MRVPAIGTRVFETDPDDDDGETANLAAPMRATDLPDENADEFYIEAIHNTVWAVNRDCPKDDDVVGTAYESQMPNPANEPGEPGNATVYHYPTSKLVSEGALDLPMEIPIGGFSSGKREREQVFGEHPDAVEGFIQDARRAFTEPADAAEDLLGLLAVGLPASETVLGAESVMADIASPGANQIDPKAQDDDPETRGECQHSRDDSYRPEDDEAMCCWECSNRPHNRPEKFSTDDPAGPTCSQFGRDPWKLRNAVIKSVDLSGLPENVREAYDGDQRGLLSDIAALRSDDEDDIRRAALRMAYRPHLGDVEEYNHNRTLALLRDHGAAQELPIIGDGSYEAGGGA